MILYNVSFLRLFNAWPMLKSPEKRQSSRVGITKKEFYKTFSHILLPFSKNKHYLCIRFQIESKNWNIKTKTYINEQNYQQRTILRESIQAGD